MSLMSTFAVRSLGRAVLGLALLLGACVRRAPLPPPASPLTPTPDEDFRHTPPPVAAGVGEAMPRVTVQEARLANGLTLWVVEQPDAGQVALSFVSPRGGQSFACESGELAALSARAVIEAGVQWRNGRTVLPPTVYGERVHVRAQPDSVRFDLRLRPRATGLGLDVLARTLRRPAFSPELFDRVRLAEVNAIQGRETITPVLRRFAARVAVDDSAERWLHGRIRVVRSSTPEAVRTCATSWLRPDSSTLVAVGGMSFEQLHSLVDEHFGDWRMAASPPRPPTREAPWSARRRTQLMLQPTSNARVVMLQPAPRRPSIEHEAHFALITEVLAGSLLSRLNTSLRHAEGATYGVGATLVGSAGQGLLSLEVTVENEDVLDTVLTVESALRDITRYAVTPEELRAARRRVASRLVDLGDSRQELARWLAGQRARGRSASDVARYAEAVASASAEDLLRLAQGILRPEELHVAVAGPALLRRALRTLGPVEELRVDRP